MKLFRGKIFEKLGKFNESMVCYKIAESTGMVEEEGVKRGGDEVRHRHTGTAILALARA